MTSDSPLNNFFEKIFCINLDRRSDRWNNCVDIFNNNNLSVERVSAFDSNNLRLPVPFKGQLANTISMLEIYKKAKELDLDNVLILEDDVYFEDNIQSKFESLKNQIPNDWDIIYFGANNSGGLHQISENIYKVSMSFTTHMYAVRKKIFDSLIENFSQIVKNNIEKETQPAHCIGSDFLLGHFQKNNNCYVIRPHLAFQRPDFSDIEMHNVNYDPFLKK